MNQPDASLSRRLHREFATLEAMVALYCQAHHCPTDIYCPECRNLLTYARKRLTCCPYQDDKPTCSNCPIHCYGSNMRDRVKAVMRYAGPRMIIHHPLMALRHMLDNLKKPPANLNKKR